MVGQNPADFGIKLCRLELKGQATNSDLRKRSCSAAPLEGCGSALGPAHDFAATLLRTNNRSCHSSLELDSVPLNPIGASVCDGDGCPLPSHAPCPHKNATGDHSRTQTRMEPYSEPCRLPPRTAFLGRPNGRTAAVLELYQRWRVSSACYVQPGSSGFVHSVRSDSS